MEKNKYEKAIDKIAKEYDAFYIENKYESDGGTHKEQFKLLEELTSKGAKVHNALEWIKHEYDCYYHEEIDTKEGPFEYLRRVSREE